MLVSAELSMNKFCNLGAGSGCVSWIGSMLGLQQGATILPTFKSLSKEHVFHEDVVMKIFL